MKIPHNWKPRPYQIDAWNYWVRDGGKHMELIWHRRSGKDEIALHGTAVKLFERPANYWHMLPLANQARKAIWDAVNPRTGKRRIDEAFPHEIRTNTRDQEMMIRFVNGATWQVLGSDNFQSAVGSTPAGIVYSEWALANPTARGYLRPILAENGGWEAYITTPRGKNHAYSTFREAQRNPDQFAQLLTVRDTGMLSEEQLATELREYIATYGEAMGVALFEQEYMCSFDAAIMGAYYGEELRKLEQTGRVCIIPHDDKYPVHVAFDIGFDDDTAIWWFQVVGGEIRILEYYASSGKSPDHYCSQLLGREVSIDMISNDLRVSKGADIPELSRRRAYRYGSINLPHDAKAKTLAAKGKSIEEQFAAVFGWGKVQIVPSLSLSDGINAARKLLGRCYIHSDCEDGIEALRQYQREWDDTAKAFKDRPLHNWTSHAADAFRYMAIAWAEERLPRDEEEPKWPTDRNFNQMLQLARKRRLSSD